MNGDDSRIEAALRALEAKLAPVTLTERRLEETDMSARPAPHAAADKVPEGLEETLDPLIDDLRDAVGEL